MGWHSIHQAVTWAARFQSLTVVFQFFALLCYDAMMDD